MKRISPYLKLQVIAAIDYAEGKTRRERIKEVSKLTFKDEYGKPARFTWRTISTWYCRYSKHGFTSMEERKRSDTGKPRKTTPEELQEAINLILPHFRGNPPNRMEVYKKIIEKGIISQRQLAQTTFYRMVNEYELLNNNNNTNNKRRLAFAMQYANELWQMDTMYGPYLKDENGKSIQTKLIAIIDDASRVICHGQFFYHENIDALITSLRTAFYKRGVPQQIYCDNGGIYTSKEITLICARIGCILRHAPLRDGAAKGKIERFFRRLREQFLSKLLDLSSLDTLNKQLNIWLEDDYNSRNHAGIGMKPIDRYALDLKQIRFLPPNQFNDELFYTEETRKVKKDNTFPFKNRRYETPVNLRDKQITIRFDRNNPSNLIIFYKNNRVGKARELNLIANGKLRQNKKEKK